MRSSFAPSFSHKIARCCPTCARLLLERLVLFGFHNNRSWIQFVIHEITSSQRPFYYRTHHLSNHQSQYKTLYTQVLGSQRLTWQSINKQYRLAQLEKLKQMSTGCELTRLAKVAGVSAGVTLFLTNELGLVSKVEGNSMQPTFNPHCGQKNEQLRQLLEKGLPRDAINRELKTRLQQDRVILNKWSTRDKRNLKVGDVVVLVSPRDPTKIMIKRITAVAGDSIYIIETGETKVIEEGHCWVEGDNQQSSYDSNDFGQVPLGLIEGKVCYIIWPLHRMRQISCDPNLPYPRTKTILLTRKDNVDVI